MPAPAPQHSSDLFPELNPTRFNMNPRQEATDDQVQSQGLMPGADEMREFAKVSGKGGRFQGITGELADLEHALSRPIPKSPSHQQVLLNMVERQYSWLYVRCKEYNKWTLGLTKKGRMRKRLAKKLIKTVESQLVFFRQNIRPMDLAAYAGKMTFGQAMLEAKSGFSLGGRANVPEAEKAANFETPDIPLVTLGQIDDRVMDQSAAIKNPAPGTARYSKVGENMSKMLRMPNLRGEEGVSDPANQLEDGKTYYFKRNLGDTSFRGNADARYELFLEMPYLTALNVVVSNGLPIAIPHNPSKRQREGVRLYAMLHDPKWNEIPDYLPDGNGVDQVTDRWKMRERLSAVAADLMREDGKPHNTFVEFGGIERANAILSQEYRYMFPNKTAQIRAAIAQHGGIEDERRQKVLNSLPSEYRLMADIATADEQEAMLARGYKPLDRDVFNQKNIRKRNANTAKKDVAYYKIDQLLGLNLVPKTILAQDAHGRVGRLMEQFKGKEAQVFIREAYAENPQKAQERFRKERNLYKRISEMHLLDLICGQGDRHAMNFTIFENDQEQLDVQAFDNDIAFGSKTEGFRGMTWTGGFSRFVPQEAADTVLGVTIDQIAGAVGGLLDDEEIRAMGSRLRQVQTMLQEAKDNNELYSDEQWESMSDETMKNFWWEGSAMGDFGSYMIEKDIAADIALHKGITVEQAQDKREFTRLGVNLKMNRIRDRYQEGTMGKEELVKAPTHEESESSKENMRLLRAEINIEEALEKMKRLLPVPVADDGDDSEWE